MEFEVTRRWTVDAASPTEALEKTVSLVPDSTWVDLTREEVRDGMGQVVKDGRE